MSTSIVKSGLFDIMCCNNDILVWKGTKFGINIIYDTMVVFYIEKCNKNKLVDLLIIDCIKLSTRVPVLMKLSNCFPIIT